MKGFYVLIERNNEFSPYNIMPYLVDTWNNFLERVKPFQNNINELGEYWKIPVTFEDYKKWIDGELKYQYWSRCEYEILLVKWPSSNLDKAYKIDIYKQCQMNLDLITELFIQNIDKNEH